MQQNNKIVFFFCGETIDPVAGKLLLASMRMRPLEETDIFIDEESVSKFTDEAEKTFY